MKYFPFRRSYKLGQDPGFYGSMNILWPEYLVVQHHRDIAKLDSMQQHLLQHSSAPADLCHWTSVLLVILHGSSCQVSFFSCFDFGMNFVAIWQEFRLRVGVTHDIVLNKTQKFDVGIPVVEKDILSSIISVLGLLQLLSYFSIMSTDNSIILITVR